MAGLIGGGLRPPAASLGGALGEHCERSPDENRKLPLEDIQLRPKPLQTIFQFLVANRRDKLRIR
eukprot:4181656-Amphidinium_carterae.1